MELNFGKEDKKEALDCSSKRLTVLKLLREQTRNKSECLTEIASNSDITRKTIRSHAQELSSEDLVELESKNDQSYTNIRINDEGISYLEKIEWLLDEPSDLRKDVKLLAMLTVKIRREILRKEDYDFLFPLRDPTDRVESFEGELNLEKVKDVVGIFDAIEIMDDDAVFGLEKEKSKIDQDEEGDINFELIGVKIPEPYRKRFLDKDIDPFVRFITKPRDSRRPRSGLFQDIRLLILAKLPWTGGLVRTA